MSENTKVAEVKNTPEYKKYQEMKAKFSSVEKEEAERVVKVQKQLKGLKSGLLRSLKLLFVSSSNNEDMMKELRAGLTFEIEGYIKVDGERQEIAGSHKITVKLI